ncbi:MULTISPECIES: CBS domain-containing protein [unclassified Sinorhizobium]|uniref:CBS domain-containing protein n=1 Tax=unclassified Sinorhizobium TaxID=2613772 RepID=UPI003526184A
MHVKDVMMTKVVTVSPDNSVKRAAEVMLANHVSGLPVVDDKGRLVGIISEGDLLRRAELGGGAIAALGDENLSAEERARLFVKSNAWKVGDVMSASPVTVMEDALLMRVARLMEEHHIKRLPVMRGDTLVGIVSRADLLQAIVSAELDGTAPGDEAISRSIAMRLKENAALERQDVLATVTDGIVHLWGSVDSAECRNVARVVAENVRGVKGVVEHFGENAGGA